MAQNKVAGVDTDTLMCVDYDVPIGAGGICPTCAIPHDMQSTYILKAGQPLPEPPRRVLLVDDDRDIREMVAAYLKEKGYQVYQEADGHGAFERYRESYPFVFVITDFQFIPGQHVSSCGTKIRDGVDLVREIRTLIPKQPMAMMSGDPRAARLALAQRASSVFSERVPLLEKPFSKEELLSLIEKA